MFTTAGDTFFTSGAKLCCWISATGEDNVCGTAEEPFGALSVAGAFSAHTNGESANVAPRPKAIAAARFLFSQGCSSNWSSYGAWARSAMSCCRARVDRQHMVRQGDGRLSPALIRCNPWQCATFVPDGCSRLVKETAAKAAVRMTGRYQG